METQAASIRPLRETEHNTGLVSAALTKAKIRGWVPPAAGVIFDAGAAPLASF
jgi:hypothetical protein